MTVDELKKKIGTAKYEEIVALARKAKAEGKSTNEIVALIQAKFSKDFVPAEIRDIEPLIQVNIPPPPSPPTPRKS
jgi:hypothetical protein